VKKSGDIAIISSMRAGNKYFPLIARKFEVIREIGWSNTAGLLDVKRPGMIQR
jgi:hypothetical protein